MSSEPTWRWPATLFGGRQHFAFRMIIMKGAIAPVAKNQRGVRMRSIRQLWFPTLVFLAPVLFFAASRTDYANYVSYALEGDIVAYSRDFAYATRATFLVYMTAVAHEPVFIAMHWIYANLGFSISDSMLANSMVMVSVYYLYSVRQSDSVVLGAISTVGLIMLPWFEQLGQNTLRQGFSLIFILAFFLAINDGKKYRAIFFAALAIGSHYSAILFVAIYVLADFVPRSGKFIVGVVSLIFAGYITNSISGISNIIIGPILAQVGLYTQYSSDVFMSYRVGFKALFFAYSLVQCVASVLLIKRAAKKSDERLGKYCILMTVIYMLASGLPYYNRVAMMPMLLLPVVLVTLYARITAPRRFFRRTDPSTETRSSSRWQGA
ncbi:EpsG family protein [Mesorhizobium loti]|uniref:EpsG family protein n=1 Tax=Rhizobium loti TaxID=381 RepID=UPI001476300C|nr:EpsG family protein [Mesorhizobium loti]